MTGGHVPRIDVGLARSQRNWTWGELIRRCLWGVLRPLFSLSPRLAWGWRRWLLKCFGAQIGRGVHIWPSAQIAVPWSLDLRDGAAIGDRAILYSLGRITIREGATISQGAHLCAGTHDVSDPARPLLRLPIDVGAGAWVAADAFLGPGVKIGEDAIVGARAVVMRDVPPNVTVGGNPARVLSSSRKTGTTCD